MIKGLLNWIKWITLILLFCSPTIVYADPDITSLPPVPLPIKVGIGVYVNNITSIDERYGLVGLELTRTRIWKDPRLAFDPQKEGTPFKYYENKAADAYISKIWRPTIEVDNGVGAYESELRSIKVKSEGIVIYQQTFHQKIITRMNLRKFPFDKQTLTITQSPFIHSAKEVQFIILPQYQGMNQDNLLEEWKNTSIKGKIFNKIDPVQKENFSNYSLSINLERQPYYYIFQVILFLMIIVFTSFCVFWMLKQRTANLITITLTSILTVVVFHWQIYQALPYINYMTFMDAFLLWSFIIDSFTILAILIMAYISFPLRVAKICRILLPTAYLIGIMFIYYLFVGFGG